MLERSEIFASTTKGGPLLSDWSRTGNANAQCWKRLSPDSLRLFGSDKSVHTPEGSTFSLALPFGSAAKTKEPDLKGRTVFPCWMEACADYMKSNISLCPAAHSGSAGWNLTLQRGAAGWTGAMQKGVEHSLPSHSPPYWRPPKINSAPFPRRGSGLLQHLRAINLKEKVQQVFQFPSPGVGMLAFINAKWLMCKLYTSAQGYHFRWLCPCSLRELSFYLCQEGSDCKREASAPTTEGSLPLSLS